MQADLIIKNAKCLTMTSQPVRDWIAIAGSDILALGMGEDYLPLAGEHTTLMDAAQCTVLPGFIDSHFHVVQTALNAQSVNLRGVHSHEEIGRLVRRARTGGARDSITAIGLDVAFLDEQSFPNRLVLDRYCSDVPLWINCLDYQVSMLNTYGLLYYKVPFTIQGVEKDQNDVATGIFYGQANAMLRRNILENMPQKTRFSAVSEVIPGLLAAGITTVNAVEGGYMYSDKDADFIYESGGDFPVDMVLFYQTMDIEKIKRMGLGRIGASLYLDGTMGARTAALSMEYADCPGRMGSLNYARGQLESFVAECYENHLQLSLYAIGDRAIEAALDAHEYARHRTGITGLRHRLEHVELANARQIRRASEMGIIFSMNPTYETYWGGSGKMYESRLGPRYTCTNMYRSIVDQGVCLVGGSDSDITEYNPMVGIHAAVNHPVAKHRVGVYEALQMYTCNGAFAIGEELRKGTLEPGKLADVILLDRDVLAEPSEALDQVKVLATVKSGELLYNLLN